MIQIRLLINRKKFCLDNLERAGGSLTLTCFVSPWKCKAQHSHGETQTASPSRSQSRHGPLFGKQQTSCWTFEEATTPRSGLPQHREFGVQLQQSGRRATKGTATPAPKVTLLPALTSIRFTNLAMASVNFTITMLTRLTGVFHPVLGKKTKKPLNPYRFGSTINTLHCHGHAFASGTSPGGIFFCCWGSILYLSASHVGEQPLLPVSPAAVNFPSACTACENSFKSKIEKEAEKNLNTLCVDSTSFSIF
jgi:hypothetical protein